MSGPRRPISPESSQGTPPPPEQSPGAPATVESEGGTPIALERWVRAYGGMPEAEAGATDPTRRGIRALEAALTRTGRNREGAFALLAADALLTSAVRGAMEEEEPETGFRRVLREIARLVPESEE